MMFFVVCLSALMSSPLLQCIFLLLTMCWCQSDSLQGFERNCCTLILGGCSWHCNMARQTAAMAKAFAVREALEEAERLFEGCLKSAGINILK